MKFLSCGFASVILFMVGRLALDYARPMPIPLVVFALICGILSARFALAALGIGRRRQVNEWR